MSKKINVLKITYSIIYITQPKPQTPGRIRIKVNLREVIEARRNEKCDLWFGENTLILMDGFRTQLCNLR